MKNAMYTGQKLQSGMGFKIIRVDDRSATKPNYESLKKWCKKNCSGTWAFTPLPTARTEEKGHETNFVISHYFAFLDDADLVPIALYLGKDNLRIRSMWPTNVKFTIFLRFT